MGEKVFFGAPWATGGSHYLPRNDIEVDAKGQCPMPDVLALTPLHLAGCHRQPRVFTLQGLHTRHLIGGDDPLPVLG